MNGFRYKLYQFMQGRRGMDQLSKTLFITAMILLLIGALPVKFGMIAFYAGTLLYIYGFYRAFSRNIYKREMENRKFLQWKYSVTKGKTLQQYMADRKYYTYFKCPGCGQKMRAPKGKGNVKVKCHTCNTEFNKKV